MNWTYFYIGIFIGVSGLPTILLIQALEWWDRRPLTKKQRRTLAEADAAMKRCYTRG